MWLLLLKATEGRTGMIPLGGRNVVTMSVKPSVFEVKVATKVATIWSEVVTNPSIGCGGWRGGRTTQFQRGDAERQSRAKPTGDLDRRNDPQWQSQGGNESVATFTAFVIHPVTRNAKISLMTQRGQERQWMGEWDD